MTYKSNISDLSLKRVVDITENVMPDERFITLGFAMLRSIKGISDVLYHINVREHPYRLTEGRIVHVRSGYAKLKINLREIELKAGQIIVASAGTVMQVEYISHDFDLSIIAFPDEFMDGCAREGLLLEFLRGKLFVVISPEKEDCNRIKQMFRLVWNVSNDNPFHKAEMQCLISALFYQINVIRRKNENLQDENFRPGRKEEIMNGFIKLLNDNITTHRDVSFYAGKLFLTTRYFGAVIKTVSGRTPYEWITEAVMQEAKILLRHTDKPVYAISDEMNFPNSSFFCKFFKKQSGMTPETYRNIISDACTDK